MSTTTQLSNEAIRRSQLGVAINEVGHAKRCLSLVEVDGVLGHQMLNQADTHVAKAIGALECWSPECRALSHLLKIPSSDLDVAQYERHLDRAANRLELYEHGLIQAIGIAAFSVGTYVFYRFVRRFIAPHLV